MKKVMSLLLVLVLALGLTACAAEQKDPKEAYKDAAEKLSGLTSSDATMVMDLNMTMGEQSVTMSIHCDSKIDRSEADPKMAMRMSVDIPNMGSADMNYYYVDGYMYIEMLGQQVKVQANAEEALENVANMPVEEIEEEAFKTISSQVKDGVTTISYTADGSKMTEYIKSLLASTQAIGSDDEVSLSDMSGTIVIDKAGYMTSMSMELPVSMVTSGTSMEAQMSLTMTYNNPGQPVSIQFPDFSTFQERVQN